jgi:hypothetical protein
MTAIRWFPPDRFDTMARVGGLLRAMTLRADIAAVQKDRATARKWALPISILWSSGSREHRAIATRMRTLSK